MPGTITDRPMSRYFGVCTSERSVRARDVASPKFSHYTNHPVVRGTSRCAPATWPLVGYPCNKLLLLLPTPPPPPLLMESSRPPLTLPTAWLLWACTWNTGSAKAGFETTRPPSPAKTCPQNHARLSRCHDEGRFARAFIVLIPRKRLKGARKLKTG